MPLPHAPLRLAALLLAAALAAPGAGAQIAPLCHSDGVTPPRALLERFIDADCAGCWGAADSPAAARGTLALDWVLPGAQGDEAPLSAVARRDSQQRRAALPVPPDARGALHSANRRQGTLRVAQGPALGGYVGASLAFPAARGTAGPLTGWLALIERLPAGTEGSPVPRQLVRNLLSEPIAPQPPAGPIAAQLWRPMNIPEGARAERLRVAGWVTDARGRVLAAAESHCQAAPAPPARGR